MRPFSVSIVMCVLKELLFISLLCLSPSLYFIGETSFVQCLLCEVIGIE